MVSRLDNVTVTVKSQRMRLYLKESWTLGPLGIGGSVLKACGMGAAWTGVPCNELRGYCNALLLWDTTSLEHDTHLQTFYHPLTHLSGPKDLTVTQQWPLQREVWPSDSSSQLHEATMEQSLEAWPWGHDASSMSSPLSLYTEQAGQKNHKSAHTCTDTCKQTPHSLILQTWTQMILLFTSWAAPTNIHYPRKSRWNASSPVFVFTQPVTNSTNSMINDCVLPLLSRSHPPFPPLCIPSIPLFSPSSASGKYLSGGLPGVYAVLDVSNPRVLLQRVNGFQDVLSPIFHLWEQPDSVITLWALFKAPHQGTEHMCVNVSSAAMVLSNNALFVDFHDRVSIEQMWGCSVPTLRTNVSSLSGISSGMVVLTSTMADRGMLTLGFED